MDKFRIRGGDFIGILMPGIMLLSNMYLLFSNQMKTYMISLFGSNNFTIKEDVIAFLIFIVFSYVVGVILRLFSPDNPDYISGLMYSFLEFLKTKMWRPRGVFPYFNWFMEKARYNNPDIRDVFDKYLPYVNSEVLNQISAKEKEDFGKIIDTNTIIPRQFRPRSFLNYCKLYILHNSNSLGEEVLFSEGLSRMISGLFYSALFSLVAIIITKIFRIASCDCCLLLTLINGVVLVMTIKGIRQIRVKEVLLIFASYAILKKFSKNLSNTPITQTDI